MHRDCGQCGRMPESVDDEGFAPLPEDEERLDEQCPRVRDVRIGRANSTLSVRVVSFLIDNNIFHRLNPHLVASHEQLAFMVALEPDQVYVPCSDKEGSSLSRHHPLKAHQEAELLCAFLGQCPGGSLDGKACQGYVPCKEPAWA